jgi:hypothetical protein
MKVAIILFALIISCACTERMLTLQTLEEINNIASWAPHLIEENPFKDYNITDMQKLLGTHLSWSSHSSHLLTNYNCKEI